jgi:hypothetical protein
MSNYGIKVAKKDNSVFDKTTTLLLDSKYPFAKIDSTIPTSFQTIDISFLATPTSGVETEVYSFAHGYDYTPQVWGLWNVTYPVTIDWIDYIQAYGYYVSGTGAGARLLELKYTVDSTNVKLYVTATDSVAPPEIIPPINIVGVTARLTIYIFTDDLTDQDYTLDN